MSWEDLVTTALLGTTRRPLEESGVDEQVRALLPVGDPPAQLLDAAALTAVRRRAGARLLRADAQFPEPAAPEPRRTTPPAATRTLQSSLRSRDTELLLEFLALAGERGLVVAPEALPALLDAGVGNRAVADAAAGVLGTRGRWLAAQRDTWVPQAARSGTGRAEEWEFATLPDRVEILRALRRDAPDHSRELLRRSWSTSTPDERERFTAELATGLAPADEDLLELALADRRRGTRDHAAALLARLPTSGYARRTLDRVAACVRWEQHRFVVEPPLSCDEPGVELRSEGVRAHRLRQLVAATPLGHWTALVGGTPADVLAVPVGDGWRATLVEAWTEAAVRQADPTWAAALVPTAGRAVRGDLLTVLDPPTRARVVGDLLARRPADAALATAVLRDCPAPWAPELGTAALADTVTRSWPASAGIGARERFDVLAHRLPPAQAPLLRECAVSAGWSDAARAFALRALDVLESRRSFHAALHEELEHP